MAYVGQLAGRRGRSMPRLQLHSALAAIICCALALGLTNPFDKTGVNLVLGFIVFVLGLLPVWVWARNPFQNPVPVLPLHGMFYSLCFGLAGFVVPRFYMSGIRVSEDEYTLPLLLTALALPALYGGYWAGLRVGWPSAPRFLDRDEPGLNQFAFAVLLPASVLAGVGADLAGLSNVYNVLSAIRTFSFVWVLHLAFRGGLGPRQCSIAVLVVSPIYLLLFSGLADGYLVGFLRYGQLIGLAYLDTHKRLPIVALAVVVVAVVALNPAKREYRNLTWGSSQGLSRLEKVGLFAQLAYEKTLLNPRYDFVESVGDSYTRLNHLHATAAVVADAQGYLGGETYLPLFTKWIPRVLWPNKPREDLGNRWAHSLGYLDKNDYTTSFNLPWLPEMYLNFGPVGIVVGNLAVGFLMAGVWSVFAKGIRSSMGFAVGLVICSSFFFPESNFSMDMGNLVVAAITILALGFALTLYRPMASRRPLAHRLAE